MPIYEYSCSACGKSFEILQKIEDPAPESCQHCASGPVHKRMSRTGFILKGGGWYVTDFRGGSNKPAETQETSPTASSDNAAKAGESKPTETKVAESKPTESKSEAKPAT